MSLTRSNTGFEVASATVRSDTGRPWALYSVQELANVSFNFFNLCISHGRLYSLITREKQRRREFVGEIATLGKYLKAEVSYLLSRAYRLLWFQKRKEFAMALLT